MRGNEQPPDDVTGPGLWRVEDCGFNRSYACQTYQGSVTINFNSRIFFSIGMCGVHKHARLSTRSLKPSEKQRFDVSSEETSTGTPPLSPCPAGWTQYWYSCYRLLAAGTSDFYSAESECQALNSSLVSVHTAAENAFVYALAAERGFPLALGFMNSVSS